MTEPTIPDVLAATQRLAADIAELRESMTETCTAIMDRIDRMETTVAALGDDLAVKIATTEHTPALQQGGREELDALAALVFGVQRHVEQLRADIDAIQGKT